MACSNLYGHQSQLDGGMRFNPTDDRISTMAKRLGEENSVSFAYVAHKIRKGITNAFGVVYNPETDAEKISALGHAQGSRTDLQTDLRRLDDFLNFFKVYTEQ